MNMNRREFCTGLTAGAVLAPLSGHSIEPIKRGGKPRFLTSLAAYSFRDQFKNDGLSMEKFIDYCAEQGLDGAELTSYYFPPDADAAYFRRVRRHAFVRGVPVSGTAVGNNFALSDGTERRKQIESVKKWVDHSVAMAAPHIRVFAGPNRDLPLAEAQKLCIAALQECADYAGQHGVFLGLENHGGIVARADDMLTLLKGVDSPWLGVNLDTGNFHTETPYGDLAKIAPYAVNVQVKVEMKPKGKDAEPADFARLAALLREVNYQGYVALEYEARANPWKAVPHHLKALKTALKV